MSTGESDEDAQMHKALDSNDEKERLTAATFYKDRFTGPRDKLLKMLQTDTCQQVRCQIAAFFLDCFFLPGRDGGKRDEIREALEPKCLTMMTTDPSWEVRVQLAKQAHCSDMVSKSLSLYAASRETKKHLLQWMTKDPARLSELSEDMRKALLLAQNEEFYDTWYSKQTNGKDGSVYYYFELPQVVANIKRYYCQGVGELPFLP